MSPDHENTKPADGNVRYHIAQARAPAFCFKGDRRAKRRRTRRRILDDAYDLVVGTEDAFKERQCEEAMACMETMEAERAARVKAAADNIADCEILVRGHLLLVNHLVKKGGAVRARMTAAIKEANCAGYVSGLSIAKAKQVLAKLFEDEKHQKALYAIRTDAHKKEEEAIHLLAFQHLEAHDFHVRRLEALRLLPLI